MDILTDGALSLGLTQLPPHIPALLSSFAFFSAVHLLVAPVLVRPWAGKSGRRVRNNWAIHVVSQVHALIIIPLSLRCLDLPELDKDRAFGWSDKSGLLQAVASGYFLWDTLDAIFNFIDLGFVIHGLACLLIYTLSFTPFLAYYAARCLLWEASTFFLNIHWFLDKTNRTGSTIQLVNGIFLLATFFGVRLVWGGMISYDFFKTLYKVQNEIPVTYLVVYGVGNVVLQVLNWIWFTKMIAALRKRFSGEPVPPLVAANGEGKPKQK